jgi:hypothetical protein
LSDDAMKERFWCEVLGYVELERDEGRIAIGRLAAPAARSPRSSSRTDELKVGKLRLRIDMNATDREQDDELERLLATGAHQVDIGQTGAEPWHVLADPEGNEFCLPRRRVPKVSRSITRRPHRQIRPRAPRHDIPEGSGPCQPCVMASFFAFPARRAQTPLRGRGQGSTEGRPAQHPRSGPGLDADPGGCRIAGNESCVVGVGVGVAVFSSVRVWTVWRDRGSGPDIPSPPAGVAWSNTAAARLGSISTSIAPDGDRSCFDLASWLRRIALTPAFGPG